MRPTLKQIGARVLAYRKRIGLTQEELAEASNLHRSYVSQLERGLVNPSFQSLARIATALGVSVCDLLCPTDVEEAES
ncbi:MAG: helix-turn-helix domain-containing protein [Thermus sp.]|uniref:helix-turn-helix domain-containing protein n=1 Tax=Thermus sp. TaxID=275 RepID=UPI00391C1172